MKKFLPFLLLALFLIPLYPAYAKDDTGSDSLRPHPSERPSFEPSSGETPVLHPIFDRIRTSSESGKFRSEIHMNLELEKEKIASIAAQRRMGLEKLKDPKKSQSAIRVSDTLNNINQKRTTQLTNYLTNISKILSKIQTRVNEASSSGKDISSVQTAINSAQISITNSQSAVDAQKIKDYTISATSEAALRSSAQSERDTLLNDLKTLEQTIRGTKEAVISAASASAQLLGGEK